MLEDVAGGVDVGAGVGGHPHLGVVGEGAVAHGGGQPQELAHPAVGLPRGHVLPVVVGDVQDAAPAVGLPTLRCQHGLRGARRRLAWVGRMGARCGGGDERDEEEEEEGRRHLGHQGSVAPLPRRRG